ncbi:hypothetical protein Micbo1qcDRAFT_200530 [Microdochium bolleyi]|uniref:Uncharacterized protein n=1 Tax=Microdochium bolleyi TaxID=196109 RepID=A0A136JD57_9PEZI|nr:hypothetical protein Micbo1qcDRAFT_200530 [Microdochium bolleyi]
MASLELNIDALKYPTTEEEDKAAPVPGVPAGYSPFDWKVFVILGDFLQPDTKISTSQAVAEILAIFEDTANLQAVNTVCFELAEQIPYSHPAHGKLARLFYALGRSPERVSKSSLVAAGKLEAAVHMFYQHLGENLADSWDYEPDDEAYACPARYVNFQAFLASLYSTGIFAPGLVPVPAQRSLEGAFRSNGHKLDRSAAEAEEAEESDMTVVREAWVTGASQWIIWYGQALFRDIVLSAATRDQAAETSEQEQVVTAQHWHMWIEAFGRVATGTSLAGADAECREMARRASVLMAHLEGCMTGSGHQ